MGDIEFHAYLRQFGRTIDELVSHAVVAERSGFAGVSLGDHLSHPPPLNLPSYEGFTTATWIAGQVPDLKLGHLCLCSAFRHPALLAKAAVTLDHATGGRFELGIGAGSNPAELAEFGVSSLGPRERTRHLSETIEVIKALWTGHQVDYPGTYFQIAGGRQDPPPLRSIPIIVGGTGPATREMASRHADWWNLLTAASKSWPRGLRPESAAVAPLREAVLPARMSILQLVYLLTSDDHREKAQARLGDSFGEGSHVAVGTCEELIEYFGRLGRYGVERAYVSVVNSRTEEALQIFGERVIAALK